MNGEDNHSSFAWSTFMTELSRILGEEVRSAEEVLEAFAYTLETFYPDFRQTVMYGDPVDGGEMHLILQRGFDISMADFEQLISEDTTFLKPYKVARRALFIDDYDKSSAAQGNLFHEGCAAHIPIVCRHEVYGWFTLSAIDLNYRWIDKEKRWLAAVGYICGSYIDLMLRAEALVENASRWAADDMARRLLTTLEQAVDQEAPGAKSEKAPSENQAVALRRNLGITREDLDDLLTKREREVLAMVARGETNAGISEKLFISKHTVRKHLEHIFLKIGVSNRTQAALAGELLLE